MGEEKQNLTTGAHWTRATKPGNSYGCSEYREEMILASLLRSLQNPNLTAREKQVLEEQIKHLEESMGL